MPIALDPQRTYAALLEAREQIRSVYRDVRVASETITDYSVYSMDDLDHLHLLYGEVLEALPKTMIYEAQAAVLDNAITRIVEEVDRRCRLKESP